MEFEALCRPVVRLEHDGPAGSATHLGGLPRLGDLPWPHRGARPLSFLASIDLAALVQMPVDIELPASGVLNVFYDVEAQPWGFDPGDRDGTAVVSTTADVAPTPAPPLAARYPELPLRLEPGVSHPGVEEAVLEELLATNEAALFDHVESLLRPEWPEATQHQVGGWPVLQQGSVWGGAQLASNGLPSGRPQDWDDPRVPALLEGVSDWRLLLQLDTDDRAGWMWGDVGMLYFLIRAQDAAAGRFDRVWTVLQCS